MKRYIDSNSTQRINMCAFHFYSAHKLEDLAQIFCERVYRKPAAGLPVLSPETAVVQTKGVGDWLVQYLAESAGIAMNLSIPFYARYANNRLREIYKIKEPPVELSQLRWRFWEELVLRGNCYPDLKAFLNQSRTADDMIKAWQLSGKASSLIDRYELVWPQLTTQWRAADFNPSSASEAQERWLSALYRSGYGIGTGAEQQSTTGYLQRFITEKPLPPAGYLPPRVSIFGAGAMQYSWFEFFHTLGVTGWSDLHFFYLSPCREFWGYQFSPGEIIRQRRHDPAVEIEDGNPILANNCRQGRLFFQQLVDKLEDIEGSAGPADGFTGTNLLNTLQNDIINLNDRRNSPIAFDASDDSIAVHNCHTPRREVEVLRDHLLRAFNQDTELRPADVLVMAPDINRYAPYLRAAFEGAPFSGRIAICDRPPIEASSVLNAFLSLLQATLGQCTAGEVYSLLSLPAIQQHFQLADNEKLQLIHDWIKDSGIRWGEDERQHSQELGEPFVEYSWKYGLQRLFMTGARTSPDEWLDADGIAGIDHTALRSPGTLASFSQFIHKFFELRRNTSRALRLSAWPEVLTKAIEDFFTEDKDTAAELSLLRRTLGDLGQRLGVMSEKNDSLTAELPFIIALLKEILSVPRPDTRFLSGRLTFCSMQPMRSIPRKIIAILGLNDGAFPQAPTRVGFDLTERISPQRKAVLGTPTDNYTASDEGRFLFLETILAAREKLWLFYEGQSAKGRDSFPPAPPLGELIEYLQDATGGAFKTAEEKLQAFDASYFEPQSGTIAGAKPFSYNIQAHAIAGAIAAEGGAAPVLPPVWPAVQSRPTLLTLNSVIQFFQDPSRGFLRHRCHLELPEFRDDETLDDEEPLNFDNDHLTQYKLRVAALNWELSNPNDTLGFVKLKQAQCLLPVGAAATALAGRFCDPARKIVNSPPGGLSEERWREILKSVQLSACELHFTVSDPSVTGSISTELYAIPNSNDYLLPLFGNSSKKWKYRVSKILTERFLESSISAPSRLFGFEFCGEKNNFSFMTEVLPQPAALQPYLSWYYRGLDEPLPAAPGALMAAAAVLEKNQDGEAAWRSALDAFSKGNEFMHINAEADDPAVRATGIMPSRGELLELAGLFSLRQHPSQPA